MVSDVDAVAPVAVFCCWRRLPSVSGAVGLTVVAVMLIVGCVDACVSAPLQPGPLGLSTPGVASEGVPAPPLAPNAPPPSSPFSPLTQLPSGVSVGVDARSLRSDGRGAGVGPPLRVVVVDVVVVVVAAAVAVFDGVVPAPFLVGGGVAKLNDAAPSPSPRPPPTLAPNLSFSTSHPPPPLPLLLPPLSPPSPSLDIVVSV